MTGASARLSQQAALLEELYDRGLLNDVVFISGVSAGAINAVMLNAILSKKITWDDYREILFSVTNDDVFLLTGNNRLPVNADPKRKLFEEIVERRLGYKSIGDLPITTQISFTRFSSLGAGRGVYRIFSRKINSETDTTMSLVDILMATTAIPVIFPPVRLPNVATIPDAEYVDGGLGADRVPYAGLLEYQEYVKKDVKIIYIITKKTGLANLGEEFSYLGKPGFRGLGTLGPGYDKTLMRRFVGRLQMFKSEAPGPASRTYVWMPETGTNYLLLNFNKLTEQYMITRAWAKVNNPVPLDLFIERNTTVRRRKDQ